MKKRAVILLLASAIAADGSVRMAAADNTTSRNTELTAEVASSYILTIPKDQEISYGTQDTDLSSGVSVTGNVKPSQKVTVTVSKTDFVNQDAEDSSFAFSLLSAGKEFTSGEWSETELRAAKAKEFPLTVHVDQTAWDSAKAGSYKATITFTAELK